MTSATRNFGIPQGVRGPRVRATRRPTMLSGYKTYLVSGATVIGAIAAYFAGTDTLQHVITLVVTALLGATIRNGITTEASK